jgi:hypothetical protein
MGGGIAICSLQLNYDFIELSMGHIQKALKENTAMVLINQCHKPSESLSLMFVDGNIDETLILKAKCTVISSDYIFDNNIIIASV